MKTNILLFLIFVSFLKATAQEKIEIPAGVTYKYADAKKNNKAKELLSTELQGESSYKLFSGSLIIGPRLWERYGKIDKIKSITAGHVTFNIPRMDKKGKIIKTDVAEGKLIQTKEDFKIVWDQIREDFKSGTLQYRKMTSSELTYFWSIISFDIEEPIYVVENGKYSFLVNILPKDMKLFWVDEM